MSFVVIRHPDVTVPGIVPVAALPLQRANGWYRVSEPRDEPAAFHLPDYADATDDLDAPPWDGAVVELPAEDVPETKPRKAATAKEKSA